MAARSSSYLAVILILASNADHKSGVVIGQVKPQGREARLGSSEIGRPFDAVLPYFVFVCNGIST